VWVIDKPLPAHGGARLFKVHAHNYLEVLLQRVSQWRQAISVIQRGDGIVNRARTHDDHEAVIFTSEDISNFLTVLLYLRGLFLT